MAALEEITGELGFSRAAHLLRRLTFGPTRKEIDLFSAKTIEEAWQILFETKPLPAPPLDMNTGRPWIPENTAGTNESDLTGYFKSWLFGQMFSSGTNAREKLTFFLHTHFTAISSVVEKSAALYYQNQLLRTYAFGNIRDLALKICTDNAMLILLDNRFNENIKPNENFAREFLELYTIGKGPEIAAGNYTTFTEQDVKAASKVLSGWNVDLTYATLDLLTGIPSGKLKVNSAGLAFRHDASSKIFSAAFDNAVIKPFELSGNLATADAAKKELEDMVQLIFSKKATALHICRKIYRFFVYYLITDQVETEVIQPMANKLIESDYNLLPVLALLMKSKHFFDEDDNQPLNNAKGAIIKSPLEVTIGMMRFFEVALPEYVTQLADFYRETGFLLNAMEDQGFGLYEPLDVAGYDAYFQAPHYNRNWISPNYLARRYQFAQYLAEGRTKDGAETVLKFDLVKFVKDTDNVSDPGDGALLCKELLAYLLPESITAERTLFFQNKLLDNLSVINWRNEWNSYVSTGDDMAVRDQLKAFISAVLQSAEYQLS